MFYETVTHIGGTTEGNATEGQALWLLGRAVRRNFDIDVTTDGGMLISWTAHRQVGEHVTSHPRSIRLRPHLPVAKALTDATCSDLLLIDSVRDAQYDPIKRVMTGGIWLIPPAATARLRARGLVVVDDRNQVRQSLTAQIGLFARDHRTRTTEPDGYRYPPGGGARRNSSASVAICECGFARHTSDRDEARRHITGHRHEVSGEFARALVNALTPA
ncbi:hypothetical protein HUT18_11735 [Streptomyces sp. NA04227]|uniref:hypothetical protein n=1 Tax=Streptomyces sp. NA04227 TaxID=2742136 RepID=UPI0015902BC2|nr:hypothetical protein [Streptomyces sp. NA04227]QKW06969.1 hypothetical protein HUT18_11735 [Streptomyces sp. NA04227]